MKLHAPNGFFAVMHGHDLAVAIGVHGQNIRDLNADERVIAAHLHG